MNEYSQAVSANQCLAETVGDLEICRQLGILHPDSRRLVNRLAGRDGRVGKLACSTAGCQNTCLVMVEDGDHIRPTETTAEVLGRCSIEKEASEAADNNNR